MKYSLRLAYTERMLLHEVFIHFSKDFASLYHFQGIGISYFRSLLIVFTISISTHTRSKNCVTHCECVDLSELIRKSTVPLSGAMRLAICAVGLVLRLFCTSWLRFFSQK